MIDALHSPYGAMDADYADIKAMNQGHDLTHLKIPTNEKIWKKTAIIRKMVRASHFDRVGFLSARMVELIIFRLFINYDFFVYHFLPNGRTAVHWCIFKLLGSRSVLFYSTGVQDLINNKFGVVGHFVASRYISHIEAPQEHAIKDIRTVFVPRASHGIRQAINFSGISNSLLENRHLRFIVQQNEKVPHLLNDVTTKINYEVVGYLSDEEYNEVLTQADAYLVHFSNQYELRCSGLILDAYQNGKLFLTNAHPTTESYGYENDILLSYANPSSSKFHGDRSLIFNPVIGQDCITSWSKFWKIG